MAAIPLRRRGGTTQAHALLDAADFQRLGHHRWCLDSKGYAYRHVGEHSTRRLHREILDIPNGDPRVVDHINHDTLDNRRANLRIGTQALNQQNRKPQGGLSPYRGVVLHKRTGLWHARVQIAGRSHSLGYFRDDREAGEAAAAFRRQHMPFSREARQDQVVELV